MSKKDKRVDAYIAKQKPHAQPVLKKIREMVHEAAPDCEEDIKWGAPAFMQGGILLIMAGFKEYSAVNFWNGGHFIPEDRREGAGAGNLGKIYSVKDLPSKKEFGGWVKKAVELAGSGVNPVKRATKPKKELAMPDYFMSAIRKNKKALATYEQFSPSAQRDYIEWITDAKGEDTRDRRVTQAVEWMAEGKPRNWKYMR
jgi:uncharacterized protein YdeI (YjbR/CyaY-like superfamily)